MSEEAEVCKERCQYAVDVGLTEYRCADRCMYLDRPDPAEGLES